MNPLTSPSQITPAWLTETLRENGHLDHGEVLSIHSKAVAPGTQGPGFNVQGRLVVQYSLDAPHTAPKSLYLKTSPGGLHKESGQREIEFYKQVASRMTYAPAPTCYDANHDPQTGAYYLLLEDASDTHRAIHPDSIATREETESMLAALARLHACWWGNPAQDKPVDALPNASKIKAGFQQLEASFPAYVDFLGDRFSETRCRIYENALDRYPSVLLHRLSQSNTMTVVHYDAHAGNFLLPLKNNGQVYIIDWQQWGLGVGLLDVAYLIALFWYPERRARMEVASVRFYHDRLLEYGVSHYDWANCWQDYRLHAIENLFVPFWAWVFQGEHWGNHRWHQLEKAMLAFQDLDCEELLG